MAPRQPEIGSAIGRTTCQTLKLAAEREVALRALRADLISALARASDDLLREPPIDVAIQLYRTTERLLTRWST